MKLSHKVNLSRIAPKPDPISERYQAEIDQALQRAEKAWRQAERRARKAEERAAKKPTPANRHEYELVLAEAERLRKEFEYFESLMKAAPVSSSHSGAGQVRHRTGSDDHLEQGIYKRPPRKRSGRTRR